MTKILDKIRNLIKNPSLFILVLFLGFFAYVAFTLIPDIVTRNVTSIIDPLSLVLIVYIILMTLWMLSFFIPDLRTLKNKKSFSLCCFLMFILFLIGSITLDAAYGYKPISWLLNINGDTSTRYANGAPSFFCNTASGKILVGSNVSCKISPTMTVKNATISFMSESGEVKKFEFTNLTFIAEPNIIYIFVEINGISLDNKNILVTTGVQYRFYTYEMQDKFITYLVGLLGVVFFSVPIVLVNLKNLWENEQSVKNRK